MLSLKQIHKTYYPGQPNQQTALIDINLHLEKKDFITVIGSNGAGKSTLLNIVAGDVQPDGGAVYFRDREISSLPAERRADFIGRVFQDPLAGTAADMTIAENLALAQARGRRRGFRLALRAAGRQEFSRALKNLDLGLEKRLDEPVGLLSGGQRQALTLFMAVMGSPQLLLLDEYIAALDPRTAEQIIAISSSIIREKELTVLLVTHDLQQALRAGNRTIMMDRGEIILDVQKPQRDQLTVAGLLDKFARVRGRELTEDRLLLQAR